MSLRLSALSSSAVIVSVGTSQHHPSEQFRAATQGHGSEVMCKGTG